MAVGNFFGHAKVDTRSPSAAAECDRCGFWYNLDTLSKQFQWQGASLAWTGYLTCPRCTDRPFEQNKVLILPPDPKPRINPRPAYNTTMFQVAGFSPPTTPDNQGMTQLVLTTAAPIAGTYPGVKSAVLAAVSAVTGIPTPAYVTDQSIVLQRGAVQTLLQANPYRTWMLIYNPTQQVAEFALGSTAWNGSLNLAIGPGEAFFWANAQNLTTVYQGIVTAIGQYGGLPLWAWDSTFGTFGSDDGVLFSGGLLPGFQTGPGGLAAGSVYMVPNIIDGGYAIGVVPGIVPGAGAAPQTFGALTPASLLAAGGGNLPTSYPGSGPDGQLWNNGGLICITPSLMNDGGVLYIDQPPAGYPITPIPLADGQLYSNGGVVSVVGTTTPSPTAPPVIFGSITLAALEMLGGANLPFAPSIPGQLWNNNQVVSITP